MGRSEQRSPVPSRFMQWATALLLIVGAELWLILSHGNYGTTQQRLLLLVALFISFIPPITSRLSAAIDLLRHPSPRTRTVLTFIIAIFSTAYFIQSAHEQQRSFTLKYLDEFSYAIGAQMAARFHLWMPQHPTPDFFEALELIVKPVYASMYFPGTAMLNAPAVWFGWPYWVIPSLMAGACVGLTYRIVAELLDSVAGLLCVLILLSTSIFRLVSIMLLAQMPALLLALCAIYAWLKSRQHRAIAWAILMGIFTGWCAITRPLDALALLLPLAVAFCSSFILPPSSFPSDPHPNPLPEYRARGPEWRSLLWILAGMLPFLIVQLIFNLGVTSSWHRTPFDLSQLQDYPQVSLGFPQIDPTIKPASSLPQKLAHYHDVTLPALRMHHPSDIVRWLTDLLSRGLPQAMLLILMPVGLLAWHNPRWVMTLGVLTWIPLYWLYVFHFPHYIVPLVPAMAVWIVCGIEQIRTVWPRMKNGATAFLTMAVIILCLTEMPQFNPLVRDEWFDYHELEQIDARLARIQSPALVLFKYDPSLPSEVEPVYNSNVAWPDDAPIIRAHDLGERNIEIFQYYAQHQPNRAVYIYDRQDGTLKLLGLASNLGKL